MTDTRGLASEPHEAFLLREEVFVAGLLRAGLQALRARLSVITALLDRLRWIVLWPACCRHGLVTWLSTTYCCRKAWLLAQLQLLMDDHPVWTSGTLLTDKCPPPFT